MLSAMGERGCAVTLGVLMLLVGCALAFSLTVLASAQRPFDPSHLIVPMLIFPAAPVALGLVLIAYGRRKDDS